MATPTRESTDAELARLYLERDELQQRLTAADEELDQCHSMALMIEEKEWAEHVGKGTISSRVESAFTQLHNELTEARQGLAAADERADVLEGLLREVQKSARKQDWANGYPTLFASVDAALKPAEGVGDDTTLEEDREDFKKVFVRINTKQGQSISLADMIARYEKKP